MNAIIGALIVLSSVVGGYLIEHGNLSVIFQPVEILIIFGAALGGLIISSPIKVLKSVLTSVVGVAKPKVFDKKGYIETLTMLYEIFSKMRKEGIIAIEMDIEDPRNSSIFKKYPDIIKNHRTMEFICDSLKILLTIDIQPHEFDNLLEVDIESNTEEEKHPLHRIKNMADSLPGLGIVAAVLGVVITMGKISEPPEVLGHSIAIALVGTFLGVLMCYGFVGPLAMLIEHHIKEEEAYYQVIRIALVSFITRSTPQIAIEFARRAIPESERPGFNELEKIVKGKK